MALKDEYYTISQAAKVAGVTRQTISRWIENGTISSEKIGREVLVRQDAITSIHMAKALDFLGESSFLSLMMVIQKQYGYSDEDKIGREDLEIGKNRKATLKFIVVKKDGTRERIKIILDMASAEPLISKDLKFFLAGVKYPIEKVERIEIK